MCIVGSAFFSAAINPVYLKLKWHPSPTDVFEVLLFHFKETIITLEKGSVTVAICFSSQAQGL